MSSQHHHKQPSFFKTLPDEIIQSPTGLSKIPNSRFPTIAPLNPTTYKSVYERAGFDVYRPSASESRPKSRPGFRSASTTQIHGSPQKLMKSSNNSDGFVVGRNAARSATTPIQPTSGKSNLSIDAKLANSSFKKPPMKTPSTSSTLSRSPERVLPQSTTSSKFNKHDSSSSAKLAAGYYAASHLERSPQQNINSPMVAQHGQISIPQTQTSSTTLVKQDIPPIIAPYAPPKASVEKHFNPDTSSGTIGSRSSVKYTPNILIHKDDPSTDDEEVNLSSYEDAEDDLNLSSEDEDDVQSMRSGILSPFAQRNRSASPNQSLVSSPEQFNIRPVSPPPLPRHQSPVPQFIVSPPPLPDHQLGGLAPPVAAPTFSPSEVSIAASSIYSPPVEESSKMPDLNGIEIDDDDESDPELNLDSDDDESDPELNLDSDDEDLHKSTVETDPKFSLYDEQEVTSIVESDPELNLDSDEEELNNKTLESAPELNLDDQHKDAIDVESDTELNLDDTPDLNRTGRDSPDTNRSVEQLHECQLSAVPVIQKPDLPLSLSSHTPSSAFESEYATDNPAEEEEEDITAFAFEEVEKELEDLTMSSTSSRLFNQNDPSLQQFHQRTQSITSPMSPSPVITSFPRQHKSNNNSFDFTPSSHQQRQYTETEYTEPLHLNTHGSTRVEKYPPGQGPCRNCHRDVLKKPIYSKSGELSGQWHRECFTCTICDIRFSKNISCFVLDDLPYCEYHYHVTNHSLCQVCDQGIVGECLEGDTGDRYHVDCLKCTQCSKHIDQDYMSINGKAHCEPCASHYTGMGSGTTSNIERRRTRLYFI